ncbi:MAG: Holliday junction branch migration protein RuvA [Chloroflexota bacterium]
MITSVHGTLESIGADHVVVRVGGIGLQVYVPGPVTETVGAVGQQVTLYTTLLLRDEVLMLFGFPTSQGKRLFDLLLGVSGVGPRLAMGILSAFTPDEAAIAIASGNTDALSSVRGIGKRTAARVVVDLQAKLQREWEAAAPTVSRDSHEEVIAALQALGYSAPEVRKAIAALGDEAGLSLEEQVRHALQQLAKE